jgi:16S rRNA C1402 (ribose-2'-O) methylase RsmI
LNKPTNKERLTAITELQHTKQKKIIFFETVQKTKPVLLTQEILFSSNGILHKNEKTKFWLQKKITNTRKNVCAFSNISYVRNKRVKSMDLCFSIHKKKCDHKTKKVKFPPKKKNRKSQR